VNPLRNNPVIRTGHVTKPHSTLRASNVTPFSLNTHLDNNTQPAPTPKSRIERSYTKQAELVKSRIMSHIPQANTSIIKESDGSLKVEAVYGSYTALISIYYGYLLWAEQKYHIPHELDGFLDQLSRQFKVGVSE
jgi:hypothetical protein